MSDAASLKKRTKATYTKAAAKLANGGLSDAQIVRLINSVTWAIRRDRIAN